MDNDKNKESRQNREDDQHILREYPWELYKDLPPTIRKHSEPKLLHALLSASSTAPGPDDDEDGSVYNACSKLLARNAEIGEVLVKAWERGTFSALRSHKTFISLSNTFKDTNQHDNLAQRPHGAIRGASNQSVGTPGGSASGTEEFFKGAQSDEDMVIDKISQDGNKIVISGGNFYQVAGDMWRVSYSDNDQQVADWFCGTDYRATHNDVRKKRTPGTGNWFLQSDTFTRWCTSSEQHLMWCPGIPGAGKTTMVSLVVDHLRTLDEAQTFVGVIYFSYNLRSQQSRLFLFEGLCRQIFEITSNKSPWQAIYNSHFKQKTRPTVKELQQFLSASLKNYQTCYLVLDALDEWTEHYSDEQISSLTQDILSLGTNVKLFLTSRILGDMEATFTNLKACRRDIIPDNDDVHKYLQERLHLFKSRAAFKISDVFSQIIIDKVVEASRGRFLMAELHMNLLAEQLNPGDLEDALENLTNEVDETYVRVVNLIQSYSIKQKELAMSAIMWIAYAQRPLTVGELQYALATKAGHKEIEKYVTPLSTITALCAGLIIVQDKQYLWKHDNQRKMQFVHFTTQEFFTKHQLKYFPDVYAVMTATCIEYISITGNHVLAPGCTQVREQTNQNKLGPFYDYATRHWTHQGEIRSGTHAEAVLAFLQRNDQAIECACNYVLSEWLEEDYGLDACLDVSECGIFLAAFYGQTEELQKLAAVSNKLGSTPCTLLQRQPTHLAAWNGKPSSLKILLDLFQYLPDVKDNGGKTPFAYAARYGHESIVRLLLDHGGIDIGSRDNKGRTPFSYAAESGLESIVKLLLDHGGIDVDSKDNNNRTPFSYAAKYGCESTVKLLLDHGGISIDLKDNQGRTPFSYAATGGYESIVKLLLDHEGVDIESKDNEGRTPFAYAAIYGHESIVKLLLAHEGIDTESKDNEGGTPFAYAATYGHESIVKLLLDHGGIDVDSKDNEGRTPFSHAASRNRESIVKLLLDHGGIEIDSKDNSGRTPFSYAANGNWESIVKLLLDHRGINIDSKDDSGRTVFFYAAAQGHESIVKLLLDHEGIDIDLKDNKGRTPFAYAAGNGQESVVKLLLDHGGIDIDLKDNEGRTPFAYAARNGQESVVKLLLDHGGIDIDSKDNDGRTAFLHAAARGHDSIFKLLLDYGVDIDSKDNSGRASLSYTAERGRDSDVRLLLEHGGIDVDAVDNSGKTPLAYAVEPSWWRGNESNEATIQLLLEHGATPVAIHLIQ